MNSIKKILIISAHYYPLKGGTSTHTENLCTELANLGYEVHLVTQDNIGNDLNNYDNSKYYTVHRLKCSRFFQKDLFFPILVGFRITGYINKVKPDIINISTGNYVPIGIKLSKKQSIPLVYTVHNVPPEEYTLNISSNLSFNEAVKKIYFRLIQGVARFCMKHGRYDNIISVSNKTKEKLILAGAKIEDISLVPNGVSLPKKINNISIEDKRYFTIMVTAGIIEHKGQYELVTAINEIFEIIPNLRCYLVGPVRSNAYLKRIQNLINLNRLSEIVQITGEVSADDLEKYYAKSDLYIQPSYQEGFCISVMEAMIRGIPVIGTSVGAIPELLANDRGIIISSPNPSEIANAVIRMYKDSSYWTKCAENAKEFILNEFEWKNIAKDTIDVYQKTVKK